jgi:uncharacterized membrane protein
MKMTASREIARPADEVFEFFSDASNNPKWQKGMVSCEWTSEPPIGEGSTFEQHARFMGRSIRSTFVVTAFDPGQRIVIETVESTFPIRVERRVEPAETDACRVMASITGGPEGGLAKLFEPLAWRFAQRSVDRDYDRLVGLFEET